MCPKCVRVSKIDDFRVLVLGPFWVSFWRCFWSPNGGQKHEQVVPKSLSKTGIKNDRFLGPFWGPKWSQKGANKGSQKRSWFKQGSWGPPRVDLALIVDDFWTYVGVFLVTFSEGFRACRSLVPHGFLMFLVLMSVWLLHRFQRYFLSCSAWSRQRRRRGRRPHDVLVSRMGPLT